MSAVASGVAARFAGMQERIARLTRRQAINIVAALSIALYSISVFNMFAYDDVAVIRDDTRVHSLANTTKIFATNYWNNEAQALYRPLVTLSFAADWAIAKNHPFWFHITNVLWNAGVCILVLLILAELFPLPAAFAGALVFLVHPVHVEAVANVVGRAELMAALFTMGAALLWMRTPVSAPRDRVANARLYFTIPALFFVGALCKESALMLPPLLVLLDIAQGRLRRATVRQWTRARILPFAAMALAGSAYLALRASVLPNLMPSNLDAALEVAPHGMPRIMTALQAWPEYVRLFLFPRVLLADYGPRILLPAFTFNARVAAGALILGGCLIGGAVAAWRGHGRTALALLWVPIAMLPVSNLFFPIGILVAERTLYLPLFALAVAVSGIVAYGVASRASFGLSGIAHNDRRVWAVLLVVCIAFAGRTARRIPDWYNTATIFRSLLRSHPDSFRAQWHLARKYSDAKDTKRALAYYGQTMQLWPYRARLIREATQYAINSGDLVFARQIAEQGVRAWPKDAGFHRALAGITIDLGDTATAVVQIRQGLAIAPDDTVLNAMQRALGDRMKTK